MSWTHCLFHKQCIHNSYYLNGLIYYLDVILGLIGLCTCKCIWGNRETCYWCAAEQCPSFWFDWSRRAWFKKKIALENHWTCYTGSSVGLFATLLLSLICNFITYLHVVKNPEFFQSQHSDLIEFLLKTHLDQVLFEFGRTTEINRKSCKDLGCNFSM